ncbi:hypothetical protein IWQ56_002613 [Coemansia nantahalensis]|uniref:Uncharacterized protein n=2 Tax=Coemansia TaxID=4863 RepID=A0ACC1L3R5_9FUNG|nr:hypothetical protein IWQ57_003404 [Coemansia nantahalensis]KAJ2769284.1 hypothetical protein IWQ56_002613 [Coemansia nantahalensis]KAJ2800447.1 hypothetical protein H4R21_003172 [Coemansia helicoidea]
MAPYAEMRVVWVTDLPHEYTEEKIENMFRDAGHISSIRMAVDVNGRFVGKAEVHYSEADSARNAIQVFDGEMLYTTEAARQVAMRVSYSSFDNGMYIDSLRHQSSLPAPRAVPRGSRHGDHAASAMAAYAMSSMVPVLVPVPAESGARRAGRDRGRSDQRRQGGRGHRAGDDSGHRPTAEELDAEMDAYMNAAQTAKETARQPDTPAAMQTDDE